jgi:hypothetical protein
MRKLISGLTLAAALTLSGVGAAHDDFIYPGDANDAGAVAPTQDEFMYPGDVSDAAAVAPVQATDPAAYDYAATGLEAATVQYGSLSDAAEQGDRSQTNVQIMQLR